MYLIDSHVVLWYYLQPHRLRPEIMHMLRESRAGVYVSVASVWEILLKNRKGKLECPDNLVQTIRDTGFLLLPIDARHVQEAVALPEIHGDPFDRLLVAQARAEGLKLVTNDRAILQYDVAAVAV